MKLVLVCWTALVVSVGWVCPLMADHTTLRADTITFNTVGATQKSYQDFMKALRDKLEGSKAENIPVLWNHEQVPDDKRFLLVKLQSSQEKFVTLVLNISTLYVLGYGDKYQGHDRAHFFPNSEDESIEIAKRLVFQGATPVDIDYGLSYPALEAKAGASREQIELGFRILQDAVESVSGLPEETLKKEENIEARFFIIAIQMVSEAVRFKYIERKIPQSAGILPDKCTIGLELNWALISIGIQQGVKIKTNRLDTCPGLEKKRGDELKKAIIANDYMGILKNFQKKTQYITILVIGSSTMILLLVGIYRSIFKRNKQHAA